ncbi:MAG: hypothetical protein ABI151_16325 [Chitinophagaceae bacterium]
MAFSNPKESEPQIVSFIERTLIDTMFSTRGRLVIFLIILYLHFAAVPVITLLSGYTYPDTYNGLTQKIADENSSAVSVAFVKYSLAIILIFMSPAEKLGHRVFAKYLVLIGLFFLWFIFSFLSASSDQSQNDAKLIAKSFQENKMSIYGNVIYTSYKKSVPFQRQLPVLTAEKLSPETDGYIIIVQTSDSCYRDIGLERIYQNFNDFTFDRDQPTNVPNRNPNIPRCLRFIIDFPPSLKTLPELPVQGKFVTIMYDPFEKEMQLSMNSVTARTPVLDSIPVDR